MKQRIKKSSFWMLIGGNVVSVIACFLPFISLPFVSMPYTETDGTLVLILNGIAILWALVSMKYVFILNAVSMFMVCLSVVECINKGLFEFLGIGAYLVLIANVVALIGGIKDKK